MGLVFMMPVRYRLFSAMKRISVNACSTELLPTNEYQPPTVSSVRRNSCVIYLTREQEMKKELQQETIHKMRKG